MRWLLAPVLIYLVVKLGLLVVASLVGWLLHWLVPSIDVGMSLLIGLVATGMAFHFFARIVNALDRFREDDDIIDPDSPVVIIQPPTPRSQRGRKRR